MDTCENMMKREIIRFVYVLPVVRCRLLKFQLVNKTWIKNRCIKRKFCENKKKEKLYKLNIFYRLLLVDRTSIILLDD